MSVGLVNKIERDIPRDNSSLGLREDTILKTWHRMNDGCP